MRHLATRVLPNPRAAALTATDLPRASAVLAFHRQFPGYMPTPLVDAPALAARLGVRRVSVKDESSRLGLPAFKILGASWATYRALTAHLGLTEPTLEDVRAALARSRPEGTPPLTLTTATDGNHGRAVARMAAILGCPAHILIPTGGAQARIDAIASEGARVTVVDGTYDEAVARAATEASDDCLVISDTSWPGYEDVPRWIVEGYGTIFAEVDMQLRERGARAPDLVAVQIGVGSLATAVVQHYRPQGARIVGVEPAGADCMLASAAAGEITAVPGPHTSIMAGLNCGLPSLLAYPVVSAGVDCFVAIEDEWAREGMRALAQAGIVAGETGAAGVGGLLAVLTGDRADDARALLGVTPESRILAICTEGATDPEAYERIVGHS
jgi:diaminopropionate ammonia-lyase